MIRSFMTQGILKAWDVKMEEACGIIADFG